MTFDVVEIKLFKDIVENIPILISYLVYGYLFIASYKWITFKKIEMSGVLVLSSSITNYVLVQLYESISIRLFKVPLEQIPNHIIVFACVSVVLGLLIGRLTTWSALLHILPYFGINRTPNSYLWHELKRPGLWVRAYFDDGSSYWGEARVMEENSREPTIAAYRYLKLDKDSNVIEDNTDDDDKVVVLKSSDFSTIELSYFHDESIVSKVKKRLISKSETEQL